MNIPTKEQLTALRDECHKIACDNGFEDEQLSERHSLCMVITELSEAVEADRNGRHANIKGYYDSKDIYPYVSDFGTYIKDTVEDELADTAIRILSLCGMSGYDIGIGVTDIAKQGDYSVELAYFESARFTECIFSIVEDLITVGCDLALYDLFILADALNIDLMEHIRLKMEYNKTRERLHGKRY